MPERVADPLGEALEEGARVVVLVGPEPAPDQPEVRAHLESRVLALRRGCPVEAVLLRGPLDRALVPRAPDEATVQLGLRRMDWVFRSTYTGTELHATSSGERCPALVLRYPASARALGRAGGYRKPAATGLPVRVDYHPMDRAPGRGAAGGPTPGRFRHAGQLLSLGQDGLSVYTARWESRGAEGETYRMRVTLPAPLGALELSASLLESREGRLRSGPAEARGHELRFRVLPDSSAGQAWPETVLWYALLRQRAATALPEGV
ncbi:MAG: hypothetical protein HY722_01780 [Planctomycetes bacterium]|nr:hypothetical protein [Planctomycetota bacterium]